MTDSRQDTTLSMPSINEAEEEEENPNEEEVNPSPTLQKEMAELMKPRKNLVNVHQFFPQLEHQFSQSSSKFEEEQDQRAEVAIKEIVAETTSSTIVPDDKQKSQLDSLKVENSMEGGQLVTVAIEKEISNEDAKAEGDYTIDSSTNDKQNQNNSAPKKSVVFIGHDIEHKEENPASVFATAVSEDTIAKARRRQSSIFQTQDWGPVDNYSPSMNEIIQHKADQHFKMAMECKEKGDYEQTIIYINKALGLRKEDHRYFVERAEAYIQLCDFKSAILNYKRACLLEPDNEEYYHRLSFLYYFLGQTLFDQRLYPEALECFSSAAEMNPNNVGYHIRSITCLAALHRHGECLALVNKRLETETENPDLYIMRARLHEMFRNTTLCYYDVKDALGLNPDHKEAKAMMLTLEKRAKDNKMQALQLNLAGKHREALHKISISIETNPNVADFHVLRGALHRKLGDFNAAIDDFLLALDKCDHNEESPVYIDSQRQLLLTYNDFAVECFTKGFYDEAIILLNKAIKGEKREKGLYVNRGDCFFRQNDFNFALQDYTQALELDPSDEAVRARMSVIYNEHGVTAYQEKNYSEAESKFNQAIHYNAKVGQYYISRARARYMLENMTGARQDLLMGLLLDPSNEDVISILSRLFPGKSVADVVNSRAADTAKNALKQVLYPPSRQATRSGTNMETLVGSDRGFDVLPSSARKPWSAEKTGASEDSCDSFVLESKSIPNLKYCMKEQDFNIKLVEVKKSVHEDVKDALINRKTLRYDGPRVQPLPPPMPKPRYGGLRKEHLIKNPSSGDKNKKSTNWKQFTSGIGVPQALDV